MFSMHLYHNIGWQSKEEGSDVTDINLMAFFSFIARCIV